MLRNAAREYVALFGPYNVPRTWQNAHRASWRVWTRNLSTPTHSLLRKSFTRQLISENTNITKSLPKTRTNPLRSSRHNFHNSSRLRNAKEAPKDGGARDTEPQGLSARLKKLSREYGWTAVGVYLSLSVLDFPFCFLLVRVVGTEKIGSWSILWEQCEHIILIACRRD